MDWTSNGPASNLLPGTTEGYSKKKEKRKKKGQAQSVGALSTGEKDTIKSDSGADCRVL